MTPEIQHVEREYGEELKALIAQLVEEKVQQVLGSRKRAVFEPFFQAADIGREIRRLQTVAERNRWPIYFAKWGCLKCDSKTVAHHSLGMCGQCFQRIKSRLDQIDWEHRPIAPDSSTGPLEVERISERMREQLRAAIAVPSGEPASLDPSQVSGQIPGLPPGFVDREQQARQALAPSIALLRQGIGAAVQQRRPVLTPRQRELLAYIVEFIDKNGRSPLTPEIRRAMRWEWTTVRNHLRGLERLGFIRFTRTGIGNWLQFVIGGSAISSEPNEAEQP